MNSQVDLHHAASDCPNCGAQVSGNFCHQCGQETVLHPPSTREFVHEFIGHYVALEGKLWKSLGLLLFRPGRLTLEYIKGRRARYVQPLRLYLTFSLIFFAVMKLTVHVTDNDAKVAAKADEWPAPHVAATADKRTASATLEKPALIKEDKPGEIRDGTQWVRESLQPYSPRLAKAVGDRFDHFAHLSGDERWKVLSNAFYGYAPYAIFFMMPMFAVYLKVLYLGSGRRYGEHLLFALHVNGFAFLMLTLMLLPLVPALVNYGLWLWLVFYLPTAMRRVYGGSRKLTFLRWIVLMLLHLVTLFMAVLLGVAYGALH